MILALVLLVFSFAMLQNHVFLLLFVPHMNVMLFEFLYLLHVLLQVLPQPLLASLKTRLRRRPVATLGVAHGTVQSI
jgi:hypothetical protein